MQASTAALVDLLRRKSGKITESAIAAARTLVLDFLGVAVAGSATAEGQHVRAVMQALGRIGPCPVPVFGERFDPATAALVTGTMGYSIGLTDTHAMSITHPGPSVIPAALAVGHAVRATGQDVLDAIVVGTEAVVRIGSVVNPSHRGRGFHPTATCNPFGAAAAAAYLLGADRAAMLSALGIAGSMAGGLYEFRHEGSMLMALHGGWPAASGVTAAYLGYGGFTGPSTVLEGPEGFFRAFADTTRPELLLGDDGGFGVEELSLRPYCACRYAHAGIDALLAIWQRHGRTDPKQITKVTVWTHRIAVDQESEPNSAVGARLSTRFNIAHAIVHGPRLTEISGDDLADPAVGAMCEVTSICEDPALTAMFPERWACRVTLELRDGSRYEEQVDAPKGEPANPLTAAEVESKFRRLAVPVLGPDGADSLFSAASALAGARDLSHLASALAPTPKEESV